MWLKSLFQRSARPAIISDPIRGVNLGGWLVLERWITPSLFENLAAGDEYSLCELDSKEIQKNIIKHRDTFVTKVDFEWLAQQGITAVRLPIGYWVFGDEPPFSGAIGYVDKAFLWAQQTNIKILLDLHAAPGSQNGWQESGRIGDIGWPQDERNIVASLQIIEGLAKRYAGHPNLLGIELLNEPHPKIKRSILKKYYTACYGIIRAHCGPDVWVVFSDNFKPRRWHRHMRKSKYPNMYIDTHQYQAYTARDQRLDVAGHLTKTIYKVPKQLSRMARKHPVIVGEWSLVLDGTSTKGLNKVQAEAARKAYGNAQLMVYESTSAWFYWTYKTEDGGVWNYRDCITAGWLSRFK